MSSSTQLAPEPPESRYEALFHISDYLSSHRDLVGLFRALPLQLRLILDFDYLSVFLNDESGSGRCWYVLDDDKSILVPARDFPKERTLISAAFERQQPVAIPGL